jgi:hypothetical protein
VACDIFCDRTTFDLCGDGGGGALSRPPPAVAALAWSAIVGSNDHFSNIKSGGKLDEVEFENRGCSIGFRIPSSFPFGWSKGAAWKQRGQVRQRAHVEMAKKDEVVPDRAVTPLVVH